VRVSTYQMHNDALRTISAHQSAIAHNQVQLSTGNRIIRPSDDPVGAAQLAGFERDLGTIEQYQRNIGVARGDMMLIDDALADASSLLQNAREESVRALNGIMTDQDRKGIAQEIRQIADQLLAVANTSDEAGRFVFAGFQANTKPFVAVGGGVISFQGDDGQRSVQIGDEIRVRTNESGSSVFHAPRNGNGTFSVSTEPGNTGGGIIDVGTVTDRSAYLGESYVIRFTAADTFDIIDVGTGTTVAAAQPYQDGAAIQIGGIQTAITGQPAAGDGFLIEPARDQSVFETLENLASALEQSTQGVADQARSTQGLQNALADVTQNMERVREVRSGLGPRLQTLDSQEQANSQEEIRIQSAIADVGGLDYAEAIGRLTSRIQVLEAAQQSFVRIQNLTLFRFLG